MQRLVVKPDQLIKRRGKLGLVAVDLNLESIQEWLKSRLMTEITVGLLKSLYLYLLRVTVICHTSLMKFNFTIPSFYVINSLFHCFYKTLKRVLNKCDVTFSGRHLYRFNPCSRATLQVKLNELLFT